MKALKVLTILLPLVGHKDRDLEFKWGKQKVTIDRTLEFPNMNLTKIETENCSGDYATGRFTCLRVIFTFQRLLGHFLINTYVATILIVCVSWYSFWLKPEKTMERISLGITTLLTIYSQRVTISRFLPAVSYLKVKKSQKSCQNWQNMFFCFRPLTSSPFSPPFRLPQYSPGMEITK